MIPLGPTSTTRSVKTLLIANLAVYIVEIIPLVGPWITGFGGLIPFDTFVHFQLWRLFTYMFLHGSPFHILFNMLVLWMFGAEIENLWGSNRFMIFYFICGVGSGLFSLINLFNHSMQFVSVIGASGAVLGLLTVYAYYFPARQVLLFFIIPVNIRIVVLGYALISLFYSFQPGGVISHLTHLGGILVALAYVKIYPAIASRFEDVRQRNSERTARSAAERDARRRRFFEEKVDPLLEKIARSGMDALTKKEKQVLRGAARQDKDRLKKNKILPMDLFR